MIKKTLLALAVLTAGVSAQAQTAVAAQSSALSVTADISYVSEYVFRGIRYAGDSIQPSVKATYGDFYASVWNSNDLNSTNTSSNVNETDLNAGYGYKLSDSIKLDLGVTRYLYEGQSDLDSTELYVGASVDTLLKPSFYAYFDNESEKSGVATYTASIGHSVALSVIGSSLDLSALVGFVNRYDTQEYVYGVIGAAIPYKLSENATLTFGVDYVANDDDRIGGQPTLDNGNNEVVYKVGLAIGF